MRRLRPVVAVLSVLSFREKVGYGSLVLARVLTNLLDVVGLAGIGLLAGVLSSPPGDETEVEFIGVSVRANSSEEIFKLALFIAIMFLAKSFLSGALAWFASMYLARIEARKTRKILEYFFHRDQRFFKRYSTAELHFGVTNSSQAAFSGLLYSLSSLVTEASLLVALLVFFFLVDLSTTLGALIYFSAIVFVFQLAIRKQSDELGVRLHENQVFITSRLLDIASAYKELIAHKKLPIFSQSVFDARDAIARDYGRQRFVIQLPRYVVESGLIIGVVLLLAGQVLLTDSNEGLVTIGVFVAGGFRLVAALLPLQNAVTAMRWSGPQARPALRMLRQVNRHSAESNSEKGQISESPVSDVPAEIVLDKLSFRYEDGGDYALERISVSIPSGSTAAIIGPSGAGKSTLVELVMGILRPSAGTVLINGLRAVDAMRLSSAFLGYVPQKPGFVQGSIAENIALGTERAEIDSTRVVEALSFAEMADVVAQLPNGIWEPLGKHLDSLSGGQLQRLGIARAVYLRPKILILDEPTSALDVATEQTVMDRVLSLKHSMTVIVVAHRLSTIKHVDKVLVLERGRLTAAGSFESMRSRSTLFKEYLRMSSIDAG